MDFYLLFLSKIGTFETVMSKKRLRITGVFFYR